MNNFSGLNISKIIVIVSKKESENFSFSTSSRLWDGFTFFTSGQGYVSDKNGNKHFIEKGDVILLRKGDEYALSFPKGCCYITTGLAFDFESCENFPAELPFKVKCTPEITRIIYNIYQTWQNHSFESHTKCRIMLLELYIELMNHCAAHTSSDIGISAAIEYIHKNFRQNFSGNDVAGYSSMSLSYLRTKFLKVTGKTITDYRDMLRIQCAKEMLISACFSISEIASYLGYCDIYHFSKTFKKHTGVPPSAFTKN